MTKRGVTLVELILAMMITALIGVGVASTLYAASYGTSSRREVRRVAVRSQQLHSRIEDAIRNARAILASGQVSAGYGYLVLWAGDTNQNNHVNLSELQLIELPSGSATLSSYANPSPTTDTEYAPATDFYTAAQTAKTTDNLIGTPWAKGISNFALTVNSSKPANKPLVTWSLKLTDQLLSENLVCAASLRSPGQAQ